MESVGKDSRKLNVLLTEQESEKLKKLAQAEGRSEGRAAQNLIREGLKQTKADGKIRTGERGRSLVSIALCQVPMIKEQ